MRIFLDANVVLDAVTRREPFFKDAARVFGMIEERRISGVVSAASFTLIAYVTQRAFSRADAREALGMLVGMCEIAPCDAQVIRQAVRAQWPDFEDAVQYFSARAANADLILTRDPRGFVESDLRVMSPAEFFAGGYGTLETQPPRPE